MNGIDTDTDLSGLVGKIVESIGLSRFQIIIHLEDHLYVSIESECSFGPDLIGSRSEDYIALANNFDGLVGSRIVDAGVTARDTITLRFSNGISLSVFDSNKRHESFQIQVPEKLIVV